LLDLTGVLSVAQKDDINVIYHPFHLRDRWGRPEAIHKQKPGVEWEVSELKVAGGGGEIALSKEKPPGSILRASDGRTMRDVALSHLMRINFFVSTKLPACKR